VNDAAACFKRGRRSAGAAIRSDSAPQDAGHQQVAKMADGFAAEMLQVLSFREHPMHQR